MLIGSINVFFFDNSSNEDGFALERYDSSSSTWQTVGVTGAYTCDPVLYPCDSVPMIHEVWDTVSPIAVSPDPYPTSSYRYRVKAYNGNGASYSSTVDIVPFYDATAPEAPSNVRYVSQSCSDARHHVTFTWDDATDLPNPGAVGVAQYHAYYESPTLPGYWVNLGYALKPFTDSSIHYLATTTRRYTVAAVDYNYNEGPKAVPVSIDVTPCL